jgi:maleate isomerase
MLINGKEIELAPYPIGSRAVIGHLTPSHDDGYGPYEFRVMSPEGVVTLSTSVMVRSLTRDNLLEASEGAIAGAKMLATAHVDLINYIATATCFVLGNEGEAELVKNIEEATGIKATAGGISVVKALKFFDAKKILCYTPYSPSIAAIEREYFENSGFEIIGEINRTFINPADITRVDPYEILADIITMWKENKNAEAVFCVGGCFRTLEIVDKIEKVIGIPVIGTQQANMWNNLKMCGIGDIITGLGMLFEKPRL